MGVNLRLTGADGAPHETDLCTNHGCSLLCEWLESLAAASHPAASALARDGRVAGTDELARQLGAAFAASPPTDPEVRHTADRLLDLLGDGRPGEVVEIVE